MGGPITGPPSPKGVEEDPGGLREAGGAALPASSARDIRPKGRAPGGGPLRVRRWGLGQFPSRRAPRVRPLPASRDRGDLPVGVPREVLRADPRALAGVQQPGVRKARLQEDRPPVRRLVRLGRGFRPVFPRPAVLLHPLLPGAEGPGEGVLRHEREAGRVGVPVRRSKGW